MYLLSCFIVLPIIFSQSTVEEKRWQEHFCHGPMSFPSFWCLLQSQNLQWMHWRGRNRCCTLTSTGWQGFSLNFWRITPKMEEYSDDKQCKVTCKCLDACLYHNVSTCQFSQNNASVGESILYFKLRLWEHTSLCCPHNIRIGDSPLSKSLIEAAMAYCRVYLRS